MDNSLLKFLGSDSGFGENNNSAYIELEDRIIIIDCGITVFNKLKNKFDFNRYKEIDIIITHLHNDHAGSLSQFILYLWFVYNKKANVITSCKNMEQFLKITGTPNEAYNLTNETEYINFIETEHVKELDCYGFILKINKKVIVYTGDTQTLIPFLPFLKNADEFYVDVSKNGGVHLKIDEVKEQLKEIQAKGTRVYLMHIDDRSYIEKSTNNEFIIK